MGQGRQPPCCWVGTVVSTVVLQPAQLHRARISPPPHNRYHPHSPFVPTYLGSGCSGQARLGYPGWVGGVRVGVGIRPVDWVIGPDDSISRGYRNCAGCEGADCAVHMASAGYPVQL